jgi:DNA-binding NtrC family response regulator
MELQSTGPFSLHSNPYSSRLAGAVISDRAGRVVPVRSRETLSPTRESRGDEHLHGRTVKILWIDDEIRQGDALLRLLAFEGFLIDIAATGTEGLRKALACVYDVIVLDLRLPDMFGMSVLRRLIDSDVTAPMVVSSGCYLEVEVDAEARRLGAVVLHKPLLDIEELVSTLRRLAEAMRAVDLAVVDPPYGIVGTSAATRETIARVERMRNRS